MAEPRRLSGEDKDLLLSFLIGAYLASRGADEVLLSPREITASPRQGKAGFHLFAEAYILQRKNA